MGREKAMTTYSLELRQRIVAAYQQGNTSIRKVAERFMVTKRTVHRLVKQYAETGDLTPKKVGTKKTSLLEDHKDKVVALVEQYPDWTLWQYCEAIEAQTGVSVSTGTMCRFLAKHELTLKKRLSAAKKLSVKKSSKKEETIGKL
jgi:transposase